MTSSVSTLVFSDLHLTTAEPVDPARPLWRRYKQADRFVDDAIARMVTAAVDRARAAGSTRVEVVLNGDVFDFDAVLDMPPGAMFPTSYMERIRGLAPSEPKSTFKIQRILADHPVFVDTLRAVLADGHDVIFVIGNHDLELHWPAVQAVIEQVLGAERGRVRFCEWFYVSEGDTLIEHGNQYDSYCLCVDPVSPLITIGEELRVRLPFGSYASRILVNGMGMVNPHADANWIMPFWGYVLFFWRHVLPVQPLLPLTWIWSSVVALWLSVRDGLEPAERDVLTLEDRVEEIAARAKATPRMVRGLSAMRVHPAFFTPWRIARELWLDRLFLFVLVIFGSFQVLATTRLFVVVSFWWWLGLLAVLFPPFLFYARSVQSDVNSFDKAVARRIDLVAAIAGVNRVVFGHTHAEKHVFMGSVEVLNAGTWSPAYRDVACTQPEGRKCVVWIEPGEGGRTSSLEAWLDPGWQPLASQQEPPSRPLLPGRGNLSPSIVLADRLNEER